MKGLEIELAVKPVENLDKTAHMRPFKPVRQIDVHIHLGDRLLTFTCLVEQADRVGDRFNTDFSDADPAEVVLALNIFHRGVLKK